jgi:hypothetical protein
MGKLTLILLIFLLVSVTSSSQHFDGVLSSSSLAFGQNMLKFVQWKQQLGFGDGLVKLAFGVVDRKHINRTHQKDELPIERTTSSLKIIIDELELVIGTDPRVTTLLQSLIREVGKIVAEERRFWRIWESRLDLEDLNEKTIRDFIADLVKPGMNLIPGTLENINAIIRYEMLGLIRYLNSLPISNHCGTITITPRHVLYHLFTMLLETEITAFSLLHADYALLQFLSNGKQSTSIYSFRFLWTSFVTPLLSFCRLQQRRKTYDECYICKSHGGHFRKCRQTFFALVEIHVQLPARSVCRRCKLRTLCGCATDIHLQYTRHFPLQPLHASM